MAERVRALRGATTLDVDDSGRVVGARVRDRLGEREHQIRASVVVNAAGPGIEVLRGTNRPTGSPRLRPAKGVHIVIPRERIPTQGVVSFEAGDHRNLFIAPYGDVTLIGTTDSFTDELEDPAVTIEEVHYLLSAANVAFPGLALTTNDVRCAFAGIRPLVANPEDESPESSVSRDDHVDSGPLGMVTVAGGKLTNHRAMGEKVVDLAVEQLGARVVPDRDEQAGGVEVALLAGGGVAALPPPPSCRYGAKLALHIQVLPDPANTRKCL